MPTRPPRGSRSASDEPEPEKRSRARFVMKLHRQCQRSLDGLDSNVKATLAAEIQGFFARWKQVDSDRELAGSHWDYKSVRGDHYRKVGLKQIRIHTYRAALIVVPATGAVWLLEVFPKHEQVAAWDRAANRARAIREGQNDGG